MVQNLQASPTPSPSSLMGALQMAPTKAKMRSDFGEAQFNRADGPATDLRDHMPHSSAPCRLRFSLRLRWIGDIRDVPPRLRCGRSDAGVYALNFGFLNPHFVSL